MLDHSPDPAHSNHTILERQSKRLEYARCEFAELVEEQHTFGGGTDLARSGPTRASAHEGSQ